MPSRTPLICYVRVSRVGDRTEETFRSPAEQEERARSFAASRGHTVSEVVTDLDVSGAVHPTQRPGLSEALADIEAGRAGGLVAYSLDRYSREPAHADALVKAVADAGGVVIAPDLPDDLDSPVGEFQMGVLMQVARLYRRTTGERLDSARARATQEGIFVGATLPFGYRRRPDRRMEVDPETGPLVTELFRRRLDGENVGDLARWLAERTGHRWSWTGVRDLLQRELYRTGRLTNGETVSEWDSGALVDAADWHAAQAFRQTVQAGRNAKGRHLLSGLLFCGSCGHRMVYVRPSSKQSKGTRPKYKCPNALKCPERVHVHGDVVEEMVAEEAFRVSADLVARSADTIDSGRSRMPWRRQSAGSSRCRRPRPRTPSGRSGRRQRRPAGRSETRPLPLSARRDGRPVSPVRAVPSGSGTSGTTWTRSNGGTRSPGHSRA